MIYKLKSPSSSVSQPDVLVNNLDDGNYISKICSGFGVESRLIKEENEPLLITALNKSVKVFYLSMLTFLVIWFVVFGPSMFAFFNEVSGLIWLLPPVFFAAFPAVLVRVKHQTDLEKLKRQTRTK